MKQDQVWQRQYALICSLCANSVSVDGNVRDPVVLAPVSDLEASTMGECWGLSPSIAVRVF